MAGKKSSGNKETRTRNWTIVLYPESAPENWREILDDMHIEWIESPLHDKDINANGETKKAHWHILLMFGGVKTYEQVKEITDKLNAPIPERCHNAKAMVRYMAHSVLCFLNNLIARFLLSRSTATQRLTMDTSTSTLVRQGDLGTH